MQQETQAAIQQRIAIKISDAFGIPAGPQFTLDGYPEATPFTPTKKSNYVMPQMFFRDMYAFMKSGSTALKIMGPPGAGKTTGLQQFHACLNKPLYSVTVNGGTEVGDLMGHYVLQKDGSMEWHDGPILRAAREGESVLVNEMNTLRPEVLLGLNGIIGGEPVYIEETKEVVIPAEGFRFFATENPATGDGACQGRNIQDVSVEDRFWCLHMDYLDPEDEIPLVRNVFMAASVDQTNATQQATLLVGIANKIRERFMAVNKGADALETTMSTRTLLRWADAIPRYRGAEADGISPIHFALMRAMTNGPMSETTREAIHGLVQQETGAQYIPADEIKRIFREKRIVAASQPQQASA